MRPRFLIWGGTLAISATVIFLWLHYSQDLKFKDTPLNQNDIVVVASPALPAVVMSPAETPTPQTTNCTPQPEYDRYRQNLGRLVNDHMLRQYNKKKFAEKINSWRKKNGLPLSFAVNAEDAEKHQIVYNNCRPSCQGQVHQVFAAGYNSSGEISVLTKKGNLKKIPIHKSGLDVLTLNELNTKGIPFRSWKLPVDGGPWFVQGQDIYKNLDIENIWLKIPAKGQWAVVAQGNKKIKQPEKLIPVDSIATQGCVKEDLCLSTPDKKRFFRVPPSCGTEPHSDGVSTN